MIRTAVLVGVVLSSVGCGARPPALADVDLSALSEGPTVGVEEIVHEADGMSESARVADTLDRTGAFAAVERVAAPGEADLVVRGSVGASCSSQSATLSGPLIGLTSLGGMAIGGGFGWLVYDQGTSLSELSVSSVVAGSVMAVGLALVAVAIPLSTGYEARCDVSSTFVVSRGGRPWRRYAESGTVYAPSVGLPRDYVPLLSRRFAARLLRDLEAE